MANDKIQKSAYGSTRAIIKAADVEDREPIWNPDLKELLVNYTADEWWEFPSEDRLYTGIDPTGLIEFPRNTVGDQPSGAHLIGVNSGFTNFNGNRHLYAVLQSIDSEFNNRIHKDGSVAMEEDFIFKKNIVAGDNQLAKVPQAAVSSLGDTNLGTAEAKELIFNGTFNVDGIPSFGWDEYSLIEDPDELIFGDSFVQFQNPNPTAPQTTSLMQPTVVIPAGTYIFKYEVLDKTYTTTPTVYLTIGTDPDTDQVELTEKEIGEYEVEITASADRVGFTITLSDSSMTGLDGIWQLSNFSLKEKQVNKITNDAWDVSGAYLTTTGTELTFEPLGLVTSDTYANAFSEAFTEDWYEVKYDVTDNTDVNSEISVYIKQNDEFNKMVKLDLMEGDNKKILFKSPNSEVIIFNLVFFCNTATPTTGAKVALDNFYVKKVILGDTYVANDIKIRNNLITSSILNANITGFLNIKPALVNFDVGNIILNNYPDLLNSVFLYCVGSNMEPYNDLTLPPLPEAYGSTSSVGRVYIIINETPQPIRIYPTWDNKIYGNFEIFDNIELKPYMEEVLVVIAANDLEGTNEKHWMYFRIKNAFSLSV